MCEKKLNEEFNGNNTNEVENTNSTTSNVAQNDAGSLNNGNGIMEEKKSKAPLLITICIIVGIIAVVGGFALSKYFLEKTNTKNVYYKAIDKFGDALIETLDDTSKEVKDVLGSNATLTFSLKSNDSSMKEVANILNKLKISTEVQSDVKNKKMYANLDLSYSNNNLAKGELLLNNNALYANLGELYNKPIKLYENAELSQLWEATDTKDYELVVNKLTNILKISLKEEWFTRTEEEIDVLGKKVEVYNHTLKLDGDKLYEFANSVIDEMLKDTELLTAISNIADKSVDSIKTTLTDAKSNIKKNNNGLESSIYVNKKNDDLEQANIKLISDGVEATIDLNKTAEDTFDIVINNDKIGTLTNSDKNLNLNINYDGVNINFEVKEQGNSKDINAKLTYENDTIELNLSDNDGKGTLKVRIASPDDDLDLTINVSYSEKDINKISEFSTSNYVEVDKISETDINGIIEKLQNNNAFTQLVQDLSNSGITL